MTESTIQLKPLQGSSQEPRAWFIPGANAAAWIEEICRWKIPQQNLRLYVLPVSRSDLRASGLFVVPAANHRLGCVPRAMAFSAVTEAFFIPSDASLSPPLDPKELKSGSVLQVYHPIVGVVGFEEADTLRLSDLLRQSPSRVESWNFARPGTPLNERLRSIQLVAPLNPAELFGDAPNEIGTEPISEIPPSPTEPGNSPIAKVWDTGNAFFAKTVSGLIRWIPHTGSHRTWLNDVEDWALAKAQNLARQLEFERNKEIHRLMDQLQNNPEEGLKFAIPMSQFGKHRGSGPAGGKLSHRNPDFNAKNLGGGHAADFWNLSADLQGKLRNKYRELANRELQLGRFRRAAYIFAELLGDLDSAASALKQGKHFREAALIYQDHLRRPREAAACLAAGGLYVEALEIYEKEQCFVEAGDLCRKLGHETEATAFYERAIEKHLKAADRLSAASLLEHKLNQPERALDVLTAGWPLSAQSLKCLEVLFDLLRRMTWHDRAAAMVCTLRNQNVSTDLTIQLVQFLSSLHSQYPDTTVRGAAADVARIKASKQLDHSTPAEAVRLSDALVKLAPEDKLLARDAIRFVASRNELFLKKKPSQVVGKLGGPVLVRTFNLPLEIKWSDVKSCGPYFFATGFSKKFALLLRGEWGGIVQAVSWPVPTDIQEGLCIDVDETISNGEQVFLWQRWNQTIQLHEQALLANNRFQGVVRAGRPAWLPGDCLAMCTRGGITWLLRANPGLVLETHRNGNLVSNVELNEVMAGITGDGGILSFHLVEQRGSFWIGCGNSLFLLQSGKPLRSWKCESHIRSMIPSAPHLPLQIVTTFDRGAAAHTLTGLNDQVDVICPELTSPIATFTSDGLLALIGENEGRICELNANGVSKMSNFAWPGKKPLAVVRADTSRQFAVFTEEGQVQLFRVQE